MSMKALFFNKKIIAYKNIDVTNNIIKIVNHTDPKVSLSQY